MYVVLRPSMLLALGNFCCVYLYEPRELKHEGGKMDAILYVYLWTLW